MADATKKYIKVYCPASKCYGLVTAQQNNGAWQITNFYEIDNDTAKNIKTTHEGALPPVSSHLKACASCGRRTAQCCDKKRQCSVKKGELWYQCLYCSSLEISREDEACGADIYFLLDASGSMSYSDLKEAANAVRSMIQTLTGCGNTYTFIAWASYTDTLFANETNISKISSALSIYENDKANCGGSTAADNAFKAIQPQVRASTKPVRVIFVTDGVFDNEDAAVTQRNILLTCNSNVEILAIGVTGASQTTLAKIGTVGKFSRIVGSSSALTSTLEEIANILKKNNGNF